MLARVGVGLVALVVLGWLVVAERDARLVAAGTEATGAGAFDRAAGDFRRARLLNPDRMPDLRRAYVYALRGDVRDGVALALAVGRDEPDNRNAWGLLVDITPRSDPATAARARAELARLDPVRARAGR